MAHKEPPFGFWIPVTDRASAEYAAKMSGLPVFLLGLGFLANVLFGLTISLTPIVITYILGNFFFGGFLVFSGLQIRKLKFATLPVSVAAWLLLTLAGLYITGPGLGTLLTILIGVMALCGLRGWLWLKKNPSTP